MGRKRKNDSNPATAKSDEPVQPTTKKLHQQQQQKLQQLLQLQQQEQEKLLQQQREAEEAERQKLKQLEEANNKEKGEEEEEEEEEEEVEEEYEEEVEEEEEEEGEEEEEEEAPQGADLGNRDSNNEISSAVAANNIIDHGEGYDGEEEPIEKLLEPFGKDKLINLLKEAASKHRDVADRIRSLADEDPVHRKIFVHGLGWDTTVETLLNAFSQYGEIEDCKAVIDKVTGKSKGYGFILFRRRRGAQKALEQPNKKIGNRMTACQLASVGPVPGPAAGPAAASASASASAAASAGAQQQTVVSEYTQRKIYVSNVGAELDPQKLYQFFSRFGEIEEGPLGLDKATGKPKGFCLFVYKTVESAKRALEEPHKSFEGHVLHCQRAIDGPKPGKNQQQQQQQQHHNAQNSQFQRNDNAYPAGHTTPPAPVMAPGAGAAIGFNQAAVNPAALNPALGQAISALLAAQPGLGFNLLGSFGTAAAMPAALPGMQGAFVNPANMNPGVMGSYPNQGAIPGGYNQQAGQSGSGRGQQGAGQYGAPYMGH